MMKTKIKIISTAFLLILAMTSFLYAQNQKKSTKLIYRVEPVDINVRIMSKLSMSDNPATVECDHYSVVILCKFQCCACGNWLEALHGGYGNPSNPEGDCPACGAPLEDCDP